MAKQFEDIKIRSLDVTSSRSIDSQSELMELVFALSASAPQEWAHRFNVSWKHQMYSLKREASVSGGRLYIRCLPEEFETDHLPQINSVIAETNIFYRDFFNKQQKAEEIRAANEARKQAKLDDLKHRLKFD
jgi:hypothetical protein